MKYIYTFLIVTSAILGCNNGIAHPVADEVDLTVPSFSRVVILGNSITQAGPDNSIGWNNDWGMAASKPELDYVHLLTAKLRSIIKDCKVMVRNIGAFEVNYTSYDYSEDYKDLKDSQPDLIIIQIGENVKQDNPLLSQFSYNYDKLIGYFKHSNPNVKILAVGSFWGNPVVDKAMENNSKFISLRPLLNDTSNQAFGKYENYGIQIHPSDKGMMEISNVIWDALKGL